MSLREELIDAIKQIEGLTDRELTDRIRGRDAPQQPVNQLAHKLEDTGVIVRRRRDDGLIGNYLMRGSLNPVLPATVLPLKMESDGLGEDALKQHVKLWLEADGWTVKVAWGKAHGADIEATKGDKLWVIEAKGAGSRNAMRVNYFLAILGELLQRMTYESAAYSIALPDMQQFRGLWDRLPRLAKKRTNITVIFVSNDGKVTLPPL